MIDFAATMRQGGETAIRFVGSFMMKTDPVHATLYRTAKKLDELGIPYAVCGGMALSAHGFVRATVDVDILVAPESLTRIHDELEGRGYLPPFTGSKNLRDTETGVKVEFLVSGGFPGDGKPKPVVFPNPASPGVAVVMDGVRYASLEKMIELKLASGMTAAHRGQDLIDVQRLIETLRLEADFADRLDPYVRDKYREMWAVTKGPRPEWEEPDA